MNIFTTLRTATAAFALCLASAGAAFAQPAATQPETAPAANPAASVGADLAGSACRWGARVDIPVERNAPPPANIFCGAAKRPSGTATATLTPVILPADETQRHALLARAAADSTVGRDAALRLTCGAAQWQKTPGGIDLMLQSCALNESEWPQVVAVAAVGTLLLRAEGLPSALPAMESALARMSGGNAAAFGDAAYTRDRLIKLAGERAIRATSADYDNYRQLTETARVEASRRNFGAAEGHYRQALVILSKVFGDQSPGVGLLLMELGLQISNQERFEEAAALFRRADPVIQTNGSAADRARLLLYDAFDAANRGRFDEALEFADNSAQTWRGIIAQASAAPDQINTEATGSVERGELAFSLDLEADMALRTGNLASADAAVTEAAQIVTAVSGLPPWWRAEVLTTMGEVRAAQNRMDDADNAFRAALILQQRLFGNTAPTAVTYLVFARVFAEQKLYEQSVRAFRLALDILRTDEVARSEVVVDQIAPFIVAANALAQAKPEERATLDAEIFEATQLIGKSLVDDTINRVATRLAAAAPAIAGLVDQLELSRRARDSARIALAQEVSLPDDQRGSQRENALMNQINNANSQAEGLQKQIETQFPDYSKFANPGPVTLAETQAQLKDDEALVLIEAGRERSFVILVRKDQVLARPMGLDEGAVADDVAALRKAFVVRQGQIEPFDIERSYTLYRSLFGAVDAGLAGVTHLVVVPTGALSSLPLGLLVTQNAKEGAKRDYANAQWLLRRTAISEVPSARAFIAQRETGAAPAAARPLLAVANPNFGGRAAQPGKPGGTVASLTALDNQCRDDGPVPPQLLRALAPLPDTADEVRRVAAILHADNGSILMGSDATEPRFRGMALDQYRVLYFATHGLLPTALRCQSEPALVLSPPAVPATTRDADGVLDASEVAQLRLNADLVVLSACNTATAGGQFGGESLSGLAGAFFHAGARSILASHWEVPSAQTVQLMTGMFERLGPNLSGSIAESLRQSQLAIAAKPDTAHPFFWAAFTLIGDGGTPARRNAELSRDRSVVQATGGHAAPLTLQRQP